MYDIEFYEDVNGKSEVYEYIQNLKKKQSKEFKVKLKKIILYLDLLSERGLELKEPYIKKIDKELWELRPMKDRIFFVSCREKRFVLLTVFEKQTQKTPKLEIEKAKRFLEDYKKRGNV